MRWLSTYPLDAHKAAHEGAASASAEAAYEVAERRHVKTRERQKRALAALCLSVARQMRSNSRDFDTSPRRREPELEHAAADFAEEEAVRLVLRTGPTTTAGAAALLKYAMRDIRDHIPGGWAADALKMAAAGVDSIAKREAAA